MLRRQLARKLARFGLHERRGAGSTESVITRIFTASTPLAGCHETIIIGTAARGDKQKSARTPCGTLLFYARLFSPAPSGLVTLSRASIRWGNLLPVHCKM